jgi:dolichol-phosphate mannosyltransferase
MSRAQTLVALATYNEIDALPRLVEEILRVLPEADVLVVDDNSPDGTGRWCAEFAARESRFFHLHRPAKQGLGSATLAAVRFALERDYEVLITLDADSSHDPSHLPALLHATREADVVIGSRYCPGGQIAGWPLHRRVLSKSLNGLNRALLNLPVRDSSGSFRAYRTSKLRELRLEDIRAEGYAYLEELLWNLDRAGATCVELPITFHQRHGGKSKMSFREVAGKVATLARLTLRGRGPTTTGSSTTREGEPI